MKEDSAPEQQDLVPAREELIEQTIEQQHLARRVDEVVVDDLETRVRIARPVEEPGYEMSGCTAARTAAHDDCRPCAAA